MLGASCSQLERLENRNAPEKVRSFVLLKTEKDVSIRSDTRNATRRVDNSYQASIRLQSRNAILFGFYV